MIDIDVDYDVEKGLASTSVYDDTDKAIDFPATTSTTLTVPESAVTATPKAPSEKFSLPPLSPDTPSYALTAATVVPRNHRPFASICIPASPSKTTAPVQGTTICVAMHQEVTEVTESP